MTAPRPEIAALVREAFHRLIDDEAFALAGNIAFRIVFSTFPFLIFLTTLAGFFGNEQLAERVVDFLLSIAPAEIVQPLVPEIHSILTVPRKGLLSISAALTIWSAMGGIDSVRVGLNRAYDIKEKRTGLRIFALGRHFRHRLGGAAAGPVAADRARSAPDFGDRGLRAEAEAGL